MPARNKKESDMNQTVLVSTDFSNNSLIAARYGIELAREMQKHVHIFHAYRPFISAFQSPLDNEADEQRAKIEAEKGLFEFMDKLGEYPDIKIFSSIAKSGLIEGINHCIEKENVSLVVMGAHGASGTRKDLLGNNTYDVAKDLS